MSVMGLSCCGALDEGAPKRMADPSEVSFEDWTVMQGAATEYQFFRAAREFVELDDEKGLKAKAQEVYKEFLAPGAPREVFTSPVILKDIEANLSKPKRELFDKAIHEVEFILEPQLIGYARHVGLEPDEVKHMTKLCIQNSYAN